MASFTMQMSDARLASQFNLVFIDDFFSGKTTAAERESHTYQVSKMLHEASQASVEDRD